MLHLWAPFGQHIFVRIDIINTKTHQEHVRLNNHSSKKKNYIVQDLSNTNKKLQPQAQFQTHFGSRGMHLSVFLSLWCVCGYDRRSEEIFRGGSPTTPMHHTSVLPFDLVQNSTFLTNNIINNGPT